jgi:pyruvate kinase
MHSDTQIIATIGPSSREKNILTGLIEAQMDLVRFNFSYGDYKEREETTKLLRDIAETHGKKISIIQDLPGPRIQEGDEHHFGGGEAFTDEDARHMEFGVRMGYEWIALSFVGTAEDVIRARKKLQELGGSAKIIAKIERKEALENLDMIIKESDAVMVARGDLGKQMPIEELPFLQKKIITQAKKNNKPVIVATEMLLSMVEHPFPTRAEVTDVANAVLDGADAVMLSEETAKGKHPVEAVAMMEKIIQYAETHRQEMNLQIDTNKRNIL